MTKIQKSTEAELFAALRRNLPADVAARIAADVVAGRIPAGDQPAASAGSTPAGGQPADAAATGGQPAALEQVRRPKHVAIFGAGIAGLTVAQELVERGFHVEIFETREPSVPDRMLGVPCALGGLAKTQWSRVTRPSVFDEQDVVKSMRATEPLRLTLEEPEQQGSSFPRWRVRFEGGMDQVPADQNSLIAALAGMLNSEPYRKTIEKIEIRGYTNQRTRRELEGPDRVDWQAWLPANIDSSRAKNVAEKLVAAGVAKERLLPVGFGLGYADDWSIDDAARNCVTFHIPEDWLPGEHGFRFFPCYYRNVFDTMRRIPIPDEHSEAFHATPRTVLDNLVPTARMALHHENSHIPFQYETRPAFSFQVMIDQLTGVLRATNNKLSDIQHFQMKVLKYLTSCAQRREQYAEQSWFDYLEAWRGSREFQRHIDSSGEVMVSMQSRNCDARSYGSSSVQLLATMLDPQGRTDATLNGPTSIAWFDPWRRYLENQGVVFHRATLEGFEGLEGTEIVWPRVTMHDEEDLVAILDRDYYVLALGPLELQKFVENNNLKDGDFDKIRAFPLGDPTRPKTGGALEHMSGIQFYFDADFKFIDGHIMVPQSDFRLSAIFQPQFWMQKRSWWSGYRGLLSVDISNWHNGEKWAWDLKPQDLATGVLEQLDRGFLKARIRRQAESLRKLGTPVALAEQDPDRDAKGTPENIRISYAGSQPLQAAFCCPKPMYYHIDEDMIYGTDGVIRNESPYLMCRPGDYARRPGRPGHYAVQKGNIVIAGTLMQTFVRLTTMEAANESGRHAANAILKAEGFGPPKDPGTAATSGELCPVYNLEQYEPPDLKFLKDIDETLMKENLPHMFDILDPRDLPEAVVQTLRPERRPAEHSDGPELILKETRHE